MSRRPMPAAAPIVQSTFIDFVALPSSTIVTVLDGLHQQSASRRFTIEALIDGRFAEEWLSRSPGNIRPQSDPVIDKYRRSMEAGQWDYTGEPLQMDLDGNTVNGHHRMTALANAETGTSFSTAVAFGIPRSAVSKMDRHKPRSQAWALGASGAHVAIVRAAMTVMRHGTPLQYSDDEVSEKLNTAAESLEALGNSRRFAAPVWGTLLCLYRAFPEKIAAFAYEMRANEADPVHSTVRLLRARLRGNTSPRVKGPAGTRAVDACWWQAVTTIYAVRAFVEGRDIAKLSVQTDEKDATSESKSALTWFFSNASF
jgi:hypothetical protein